MNKTVIVVFGILMIVAISVITHSFMNPKKIFIPDQNLEENMVIHDSGDNGVFDDDDHDDDD